MDGKGDITGPATEERLRSPSLIFHITGGNTELISKSSLHPILHVNELLLQPFPARGLPAPSLFHGSQRAGPPPCTPAMHPEEGATPGGRHGARSPGPAPGAALVLPHPGGAGPGQGSSARMLQGPLMAQRARGFGGTAPGWAPMAPLAQLSTFCLSQSASISPQRTAPCQVQINSCFRRRWLSVLPGTR